MSNTKLNKKGFTLIEVVLVLAIGGLIFLLAFLAFQQVSRNRRDTVRRSDAARVVAELQNYYGDRGVYPANTTAAGAAGATLAPTDGFGPFVVTYMGGSDFEDPSGSPYQIILPATSLGTTGQIRYTNGTNCDGGSGVKVEIKLEAGTVCRDDQGN